MITLNPMMSKLNVLMQGFVEIKSIYYLILWK